MAGQIIVIRNTANNLILASECRKADTFFARFIGLMGRRSLEPGCGLLIKPCNSIHMFFMRFWIDAVFLDGNNTVVHIIESMKPWRVSKIVRKAKSVLELPQGAANRFSVKKGDRLSFE